MNRQRYQQNLNRVLEYIEQHLDTKIDLATLAALSHFSPYHFHKITRALLGEPIGTYIHRVRLETAAKLIRYTHLNLETIAYNIGFETPAAFSKAFKKHFAISPSNYRKHKSFTIKTTTSMEIPTLNIKKPKIVTLEAQNCLYYKMQGAYQTLDYAQAWEMLWAQVKAQGLFTKGIQHIGLPYDDPKVTDPKKTRYDACLSIHKPAKSSELVGVKTLEGGKFAMFLYQGSYKYFAYVYDFIFNDWLLNSEYELRDDIARERYISHPDRVAEDKLKTEFYIPIQ